MHTQYLTCSLQVNGSIALPPFFISLKYLDHTQTILCSDLFPINSNVFRQSICVNSTCSVPTPLLSLPFNDKFEHRQAGRQAGRQRSFSQYFVFDFGGKHFWRIMSGRGKGAKAKSAKSVTRSSRAGLQFPVGRVHRYLKKGKELDVKGKFVSLLKQKFSFQAFPK